MTTTKAFDWSKLPLSKYGDDVWFSMMLPDEVGKLKRLHEAIFKWRKVADAEIDRFKKKCDQKRNPAWDKYGYDPVQDEAFMLLATERAMFATLGVSIASAAENFIIAMAKMRGVKCINKSGDTNFDDACRNLGKSLKVVVSRLPGYEGNQRARMLGNCFKHAAGKKNRRFVRKYSGTLNETIEYEKEDWTTMIGDTQTLLSEIIQRLRPEHQP